jgi:hypothetical protein
VTYQKWNLGNPLRTPLWRLGLWIEINAWNFGWIGDLGHRLFVIAYSRSGEEVLDALNGAIPNGHLSPSMRVVADNWNDVIAFCLPDREGSKQS